MFSPAPQLFLRVPFLLSTVLCWRLGRRWTVLSASFISYLCLFISSSCLHCVLHDCEMCLFLLGVWKWRQSPLCWEVSPLVSCPLSGHLLGTVIFLWLRPSCHWPMLEDSTQSPVHSWLPHLLWLFHQPKLLLSSSPFVFFLSSGFSPSCFLLWFVIMFCLAIVLMKFILFPVFSCIWFMSANSRLGKFVMIFAFMIFLLVRLRWLRWLNLVRGFTSLFPLRVLGLLGLNICFLITGVLPVLLVLWQMIVFLFTFCSALFASADVVFLWACPALLSSNQHFCWISRLTGDLFLVCLLLLCWIVFSVDLLLQCQGWQWKL